MATKGLPGNVLELLKAADLRNGLPEGTMLSVMQQEVGGKADRFLADPTTYHYAADAQGRRVAPSGSISTAFGPFGILESTAAQPGYGVAPLKDKSLEEQVRFASDYLAARSKSGGGLKAGLAGYGEGDKYAAQVAARIGNPGPDGAQEQAAAAPQVPTQSAPVTTAAAAPAPAADPAPGVDPWQAFLAQVAAKPQVTPADLAYGAQPSDKVASVQAPGFPLDFGSTEAPAGRPKIRSFMDMKRWV